MVKRVRVKVENEDGAWLDRRIYVDVPDGASDVEVMEAASDAVQPYLNRNRRRRVIAIDVNG